MENFREWLTDPTGKDLLLPAAFPAGISLPTRENVTIQRKNKLSTFQKYKTQQARMQPKVPDVHDRLKFMDVILKIEG